MGMWWGYGHVREAWEYGGGKVISPSRGMRLGCSSRKWEIAVVRAETRSLTSAVASPSGRCSLTNGAHGASKSARAGGLRFGVPYGSALPAPQDKHPLWPCGVGTGIGLPELSSREKKGGFVTPTETNVHEDALCVMAKNWARYNTTVLNNGWRLVVGGWRLAVGGWRLAVGGWRLLVLRSCPSTTNKKTSEGQPWG